MWIVNQKRCAIAFASPCLRPLLVHVREKKKEKKLKRSSNGYSNRIINWIFKYSQRKLYYLLKYFFQAL